MAGYKQQAERASVDHDKREEEEHKDETGYGEMIENVCFFLLFSNVCCARFHIEKKQSDGPRVLDFGGAGKHDGKKNKLGAAVKASAFDDWDDDDEVLLCQSFVSLS